MTAAVPPQRDVPRLASGAPAPDGYADSQEFLALPGMTYRKLDYWSRIGVLVPENPSAGSGVKRLWRRAELPIAIAVLRLLSAGVSLHNAARLARWERPAPGCSEVLATLAPGLRLVVTDELWQVPA